MVEQQKDNAPLDRKEKISLLDEDTGKEFLTSWNSMSVADDDPMDFSFDTVGKSNKKAFNFDKLYVDFNLDSADFDKLSSFNVDLPEMNFSSCTKKSHQDKEKAEKVSSSNCGGKRDSFSFSFDYNKLDAFNFGSSLKKKEGVQHKGGEIKLASLVNDVERRCFEANHTEGNHTEAPVSIGINANCQKVAASKYQPLEMDSAVSSKMPTSSATKNPIPTSSSSRSPLFKKEVGTSMERVAGSNAKQDEEGHLLEKSVLEATLPLPSSGNDAISSDCEKLKSSNVSAPQVFGPDLKTNVRDMSDTGLLEDDKDVADDDKSEVRIEDTIPDGLSNAWRDSVDGGPEVDNVVTVSKYNESRHVSSKFFKKPGETLSQLHLDSLPGGKLDSIEEKKLSGIGSKRFCTRSLNFVGGRRSGNSGDILLPSKEMTKKSKPGEKTKKVGMTSSTVFCVKSSPTTRVHSDITRSLSNMPSQSSPMTCLRPSITCTLGSSRTSRIDEVDVDKIDHQKTLKIDRGLASLQKLRILGMKQDKLSSTTSKESIPSANTGQRTEDPSHSELEIIRGALTDNKPLLNLSLKRKIVEVTNEDAKSFTPLKRLSESPKESRSLKVSSERVITDEIHNTYSSSQNETIKVTDRYEENRQKILPKVSAVGAEFSLALDSHSIVNKAGGYAKDLEDICTLLKKKQEEAKELLVRALVNNNNLLMLNHPIYDEKIYIRAVQKFASQLMSKHPDI